MENDDIRAATFGGGTDDEIARQRQLEANRAEYNAHLKLSYERDEALKKLNAVNGALYQFGTPDDIRAAAQALAKIAAKAMRRRA